MEEKSAEQWPPEPARDRESASLGRTGSGFSRLERKDRLEDGEKTMAGGREK